MSNSYMYNNYQQGYLPNFTAGQLNSTSPTFSNLNYGTLPDSAGSTVSSSLSSSTTSNYSFQNPRLRYYLSKSFDIEDDLEFCPDIPDNLPAGTVMYGMSPQQKKFNPYTASVFSPTATKASGANEGINLSPVTNTPSSPKVHTPRVKKPLEIINPQTKMRVSSPAVNK